MEVTPHQEKFLETIPQQGVELVGTHWSIGTFVLSPGDIELFTEDADEFAAQRYGVSKEELFNWQEFISSWQCLGDTKSGARCKATASDGHRVSSPKQFGTSNPDCYCTKHKDQCTA